MKTESAEKPEKGVDFVFDKDVYRTRVPLEELKPETLNYLKGWKRPNYAYVLFETRKWHLGKDMGLTPGTGLFTLNVEARPEQEQKLNFYVLKKRFRIIDWGNFPKLNDPNPNRAARARMYSGHKNANPWDSLENAILGFMQTNPNWKEEKAKFEDKERGLLAKVAAAEARLKALENKENEQGRGKETSVPKGN